MKWNPVFDTKVGTTVIYQQLACGDIFGVVAAKMEPLQSMVAISDPVRDLEVGALALVGLAGIEAITVALAGKTLALND